MLECMGLFSIFNLHPNESFADYHVGIEVADTARIIIQTDSKEVGGHNRIDNGTRFFTTPMEWNGRKNWTHVYIPCRTAMVLLLTES